MSFTLAYKSSLAFSGRQKYTATLSCKYILASSQFLIGRAVAFVYINNSFHFTRKCARILTCARTLSVPRSEQFSESVAQGKL